MTQSNTEKTQSCTEILFVHALLCGTLCDLSGTLCNTPLMSLRIKLSPSVTTGNKCETLCELCGTLCNNPS